MRSMRVVPIGLVVAGCLALPAAGLADVIHLKNGNQLQVEGWRDAGDVIEFMMGGGIVRIPKAEVQKVDGKPSRGDFKMYSSGVSASAGASASAAPADEKAAVTQMADLLKQGEALFGQPSLSGGEKAGAFRKLADQWRGFVVPETLRPTHTRGGAAFQMAAEAFAGDETAADTKDRVEKAQAELGTVQEEVKKLGASAPGGGQG